MKRQPKIALVLSINFLAFLCFISIIELFLGKWIKNFASKSDYKPIPAMIKNRVLKYDAREIYSSKNSVPIIYKRDKLGYRSRSLPDTKEVILAIGGSTTDERFITEGETWVDNLDTLIPEFDFINGGIDGQSSYGHRIAIKEWHSLALEKENTNSIIFYIGINDRKLLRNQLTKYDIAQGYEYIKIILKDNSFFYSNALKVFNGLGSKKGAILRRHMAREIEFLKKGKIYDSHERLNRSSFISYKKTFSNLLSETINNFPNSRIFVVQQQIPGCKFLNNHRVYDRHPLIYEKHPDMKSICLDLLYVYNIQEEIINSFDFKESITLIPMYLQPVLDDDDVYDYIHTNRDGSLKIAKFIQSFLRR